MNTNHGQGKARSRKKRVSSENMNKLYTIDYLPQTIPRESIFVFQVFGLLIFLFIFFGTWHLLGFTPAFILLVIFCAIVAGLWLTREIDNHRVERANQTYDLEAKKYTFNLMERALDCQYTLELEFPDGHIAKIISPLTIPQPQAPLTIKDVHLG